jgi:hypothetical protein
MKTLSFACAAILAFAMAVSGPSLAGAVDREHAITIPGTVVSSDAGALVIRTDDHGHRMPFDVGPATSLPSLRKGAHVSVTYRPLGLTGQVADEVLVIDRSADARSQASFKVVTGPGDTRVTAR